MDIRRPASILAMLLVVCARAVGAPLYTVVDLGTLGGDYSWAHDINSDGDVVGFSRLSGSAGHAFVYSNGSMHDLDLGQQYSWAYGINDGGDIAGYWDQGAPGGSDSRAYVYTNGSAHELGTLGGAWSQANAINAAGQIVGVSALAGNQDYQPFLFEAGSMSALDTLGGIQAGADDINDHGQIVGQASVRLDPTTYVDRAFLYSDGTTIFLDPSSEEGSLAFGINDEGQITGGIGIGDFRLMLYDDGVMQDLGTPDGWSSSVGFDINDPGQIVGIGSPEGGGSRGFLYADGEFLDLNDLIDADSGWTITEAWAINDAGQIAANGCNVITNECHALRLDLRGPTVAEPATLALLAIGVGGIGFARGRRSLRRPREVRTG